jgi:hypothetical protein
MGLFKVGGVGPDNMGGLGYKCYLFLLEDVLTLPTPPNSSSLVANEVANYQGDIVMKAGKYMVEFELTYDMSGLESAGQGETDGISFKPTVNGKIAGASDEAIAFMTANKHANLGGIFPDKNGRKVLLGADGVNPLKFDPSSKFSVGTAAGDKRGSEVILFTNSNNPAPGYTGAITLEPSSASASSGSAS